jgi:ornithine cyclodeaminase/alanine dehydrogenase-like protein (mu-crystallin family)
MPVLLSESDVRAVLPMDDLISAMERALAQYSTGHVQQPVRTVLQPAPQAFFGVMPAFVGAQAPDERALGTKLVTVFGSNAALGLHTHLATIVLLDPGTGELLAIMDGRYITEARTAAVSAVSAKLLARDDAGVLAIVGSGVQARSHAEALARVRTLREIRIWSPNAQRREAFAAEVRAHLDVAAIATATPREAVAGADLIALVSAAREPVVSSEWIDDGAHICAVGACRPDHREMDTALVTRGRIYVDSRAGALVEAGDLVIPIKEGAFDAARIVAELGEVAAGSAPRRTSPRDVTIFKSLGMAVEDVAAAHLAFRRAAETGLGRGFVF